MQLQEQRRQKFDDPICRYLADCRAAWRPIRIRQLLNRTSGMPIFSSLPRWDESLSRRNYKPDELVVLFRNWLPKSTPGETYDYANSGSHSLGTTFINAPIISRTVGYAEGGLYSTMGDLLSWDRALMPAKQVGQTSREAMFSPNKDNYGLGWRVAQRFDRREMDHSGSNNGSSTYVIRFSTYVIRFAADRLTALELSNRDRASAGKVGDAMSANIFGLPVTLPVAQLREILWDRIDRDGVAVAIAYHGESKRSGAKIEFSDDALVGLSYDLYKAHRHADAQTIFHLNRTVYSKFAYSYDGLADIAAAEGDTRKAITLSN